MSATPGEIQVLKDVLVTAMQRGLTRDEAWKCCESAYPNLCKVVSLDDLPMVSNIREGSNETNHGLQGVSNIIQN